MSLMRVRDIFCNWNVNWHTTSGVSFRITLVLYLGMRLLLSHASLTSGAVDAGYKYVKTFLEAFPTVLQHFSKRSFEVLDGEVQSMRTKEVSGVFAVYVSIFCISCMIA